MAFTAPAWIEKGRVPAVDGLRAAAITAVLVDHLFPGMDARFKPGHAGVTLFFVISGFLITLLMLREEARTGSVSLKDFWRRRMLRIMPALGFYLLVVAGLQIAGLTHIKPSYWAAALTYTMCYVPFSHNWHESWDVVQTWSLSVEEHFYLLWPLLFVLLKPTKAVKVLIGYILIVPALRFVVARFFGSTLDITYISITQMGSIAVGCLGAYVAQGRVLPSVGHDLQRRPGLAAGWGAMVLLLVAASGFVPNARVQLLRLIFDDPLNAIGFGAIMLSLAYAENSLVTRLLNAAPVAFVGTLAYSLYLWQQPFVLFGAFTPWAGNRIVALVGIVVCALLSYYGIERPFLRIKDRGNASSIR